MNKFKGLGVAMITPFHADGSPQRIDFESLERRNSYDSTDIGASMLVPGFWLIVVYFYYLSHKLIITKKIS